jgi:hypothetical protein
MQCSSHRTGNPFQQFKLILHAMNYCLMLDNRLAKDSISIGMVRHALL